MVDLQDPEVAAYIILGTAGVVIFLVAFWTFWKIGSAKREADRGSRLERKVEAKTGLGRMSKVNRKVQKKEKKEAKEARAQEKGVESISDKNLSPSGAAVKGTAADVVETAVQSAESAEAVTALESRTIGLLAGITEAEKAIRNYANQERNQESIVEAGVQRILQLELAIEQDAKHAVKDAGVINHLNSLSAMLAEQVGQIQTAKSRELEGMNSLIGYMDESVKESKKVVKNLRTETKVLSRIEKKKKKSFSKEIADLDRVNEEKKKELKQAESKENADRQIIKSVRQEIGWISRQHGLAKRLESQLQTSFSMIKLNLKEGRRILKRLSKQEKNVKGFEGSSKKAKDGAEGKVKALEKLSGTLGNLGSGKQTGGLYGIAASLSEGLNLFFEDFKKAQEDSAVFDASLQDALRAEYKIVRHTMAYERVIKSLTEAEKAVDQGVNVMAEIVKSVSSEGKLSDSEAKVEQTLGKLRQTLDYESRVENLAERQTKRLGRRVREDIGSIRQLMQEDSKILSLAEAGSRKVGDSVAKLVNSKVSKRYTQSTVNRAEQFGNELAQKNKTAAKQFKKARRWENRAK